MKKIWFGISLLVMIAFFNLTAVAFADDSSNGQSNSGQPQKPITVIIWTIAALSLSEMLRNSVQGLFTRASGFDEAGFANKAMTAIAGLAGMSGLMGLGNLAKATFGGTKSGPIGGINVGNSGGGDKINLTGTSMAGGAPIISESAGGYQVVDTSQYSGSAPKQKTGMSRAVEVGNAWGNTIGSYLRSGFTTFAGGVFSLAGAALPGGQVLANAATRVFDNTIGRGIGYLGGAGGRFLGTQANLYAQAAKLKKQVADRGENISMNDAFTKITGGKTLEEARSRALKTGAWNAIHPRLGEFTINNKPVTSIDGPRYDQL